MDGVTDKSGLNAEDIDFLNYLEKELHGTFDRYTVFNGRVLSAEEAERLGRILPVLTGSGKGFVCFSYDRRNEELGTRYVVSIDVAAEFSDVPLMFHDRHVPKESKLADVLRSVAIAQASI